MRFGMLTAAVGVITGLTLAAEKKETPHFEFVNEYARELGALESIRAQGEQELKEGGKDDVLLNAIHTSTAIQLELRSEIGMLNGMRLNAPFDQLIPNIAGFYQHKIILHQRMIEISTAFLGGPKPGVDYGELAAELPKIRGELEYVDRALSEATTLVFATLIDMRPDSKNHASHLVISKEQKAKLISDLTRDFGLKLAQKAQPFPVSAASILKAELLKGFKCSDDPWE